MSFKQALVSFSPVCAYVSRFLVWLLRFFELFFGCNNVYFLLESVKRLAGVVRMTYKVSSGTHCVLVTTQMTQSCVIFLCTCQCYYCRFLTVEMLFV